MEGVAGPMDFLMARLVRAAPEAHSSVTSPRIPLIRPERQIDL